MLALLGLAMIAAGPAMARSHDEGVDDTRGVQTRRGNACLRGQDCGTKVRQIGHLESVIADKILRQVNAVPLSLQQDSPIMLQGETLSKLRELHRQEIRETYQAGHSLVLLDATMEDIEALHGILGGGVTYGSSDGEAVLAYVLRHHLGVPAAKLVSYVHRSTLRTATGEPDPTGLRDEEMAVDRAADHIVSELKRRPNVGAPNPSNPQQPIAWQNYPVATTTLVQANAGGAYSTEVNVYALHGCLADSQPPHDTYDYYVVTALADWTATNAKFQSAATELGSGSMYYDAGSDEYVVKEFRDDPTLTYCSSPSSASSNADKCRYINYPLSYNLSMEPLNTGQIIQVNAAPAATQGQATTYQSGFTFNIGGVVNVSGAGPGGGISAGASWSNTTVTSVPPLIVEVGDTPHQGAEWTFKYCTTGEEPDPDTTCTSHVQTVKDVCRAQLGDFTGTNPQQGQTPKGKFSDAVQSTRWRASPNTRVGKTFDIEVSFTAVLAHTFANLWGASTRANRFAGCNDANCDCISITEKVPATTAVTFKIPFPSTSCPMDAAQATVGESLAVGFDAL